MTNPRTQHQHFGISAWSVIACTLVFALAILTPNPASAQPTYNVIYNFTGGSDGAGPVAGLTMDANGKLYGTAYAGGSGCGSNGCGTVYQLVHDASGWHFNRLYSFSVSDGDEPYARMLFGPGGALYGTTWAGGANVAGTVFSLIPPPAPPRSIQENHWIETVLYSFTGGSDGARPIADFAFDHAGNIYGSAVEGGSNGYGTVFKLTRSGNSWNESVLHSFTGGSDGRGPEGVTLQAGNLYGTADWGGAFNRGAVFELTPSGSGWAENTLHDFQGGNDGGYPESGVIFDGAGNMYGSTSGNDPGPGPGTIWELMPSGGSWTFSTLYNFTAPGCQFPQGPENAPLTMDQAGNLYGTTDGDGANCFGSVFKLSPPSRGGQWTYTSLHDFTGGSDGGSPESNVIMDANGNLYGTASAGGAVGYGVVWEITP